MRTPVNLYLEKETSIGKLAIAFIREQYKGYDAWTFTGKPFINDIPVSVLTCGSDITIRRYVSKELLRNLKKGVTIELILEPAINELKEFLLEWREKVKTKKYDISRNNQRS